MIRSKLTPPLPRGAAWNVKVVQLDVGIYRTIFYVRDQYFCISEEGDRTHATFMGRMFLCALSKLGVEVPERLKKAFRLTPRATHTPFNPNACPICKPARCSKAKR